MSRVIIPETACLAAPAAEHSKPRRRHGSQWRLGHSNSLSPQTPGTHRSRWGPEPPGDTEVTGCQLQMILKAHGYWARLPTRALSGMAPP